MFLPGTVLRTRTGRNLVKLSPNEVQCFIKLHFSDAVTRMKEPNKTQYCYQMLWLQPFGTFCCIFKIKRIPKSCSLCNLGNKLKNETKVAITKGGIYQVSVRIKVSYETEEELRRVLLLLNPVLKGWTKAAKKSGRFFRAYLELDKQRLHQTRESGIISSGK